MRTIQTALPRRDSGSVSACMPSERAIALMPNWRKRTWLPAEQ